MDCTNCGRPVRDLDKFCIACGERVDRASTSPAAPDTSHEDSTATTDPVAPAGSAAARLPPAPASAVRADDTAGHRTASSPQGGGLSQRTLVVAVAAAVLSLGLIAAAIAMANRSAPDSADAGPDPEEVAAGSPSPTAAPSAAADTTTSTTAVPDTTQQVTSSGAAAAAPTTAMTFAAPTTTTTTAVSATTAVSVAVVGTLFSDLAKVRTQPDLDAPAVATLTGSNGASILILSAHQQGWYLIEIGAIEGWIFGTFVLPPDPGLAIGVTRTEAPARLLDANGAPLGIDNASGSKVLVVDADGDLWQVLLPDGATAWVDGDLMRLVR